MNIQFYKTGRGNEPVREYVESLPEKDKFDVLGCLDDISENGFKASTVIFRSLKGYKKLWEIKIFSASSHRIFYCMQVQETMILLHAFKKKQQKTPLRELDTAYKRLREVLP